MIDANLPDMTLQGSPSTPPSSAKAPANHDDTHEAFAKFVEKADEARDVAEETEENPAQNQWRNALLFLTQMVQKSEMDLASPSHGMSIDEATEANFAATIAAKNTTNAEDDRTSLIIDKMPLNKSMTSFQTDDGQTNMNSKDDARENMSQQGKEEIKSASTKQEEDTANKSAALPTGGKPTLSSGAYLANAEATVQPPATSKPQEISHLLPAQKNGMENAPISDKLILKNTPVPAMQESNTLRALEGVDIIRSRKQGDLTLLQLQLTPENLGTVEAKLRLDKDHLSVELSAAKNETAKLLAKDHQLLLQTLEKAGFGGEARLSVSIMERSPVGAVQPVNATFQTGGESLSGKHEETAEGRGQSSDNTDFSSPSGEKERGSENQDRGNKNLAMQLNKSPIERHFHAPSSSHRLVV